jgi:tyrosyl-tRNA synthetase
LIRFHKVDSVKTGVILAAKSKDVKGEVKRQLEVFADGTVEIINAEELESKLVRSVETGKPLRAKLGADPTSPDIHLGHSVVLKKLRDIQSLGHEVVFLVGDFTALIGDPSGRSKTRPSLSAEEVEANAETYREQAFKILNPERTVLDRNSRWASPMTFREVIELSAKYTLARMLERDDFRNRLDNNLPISIHELLYPLLQAYDSVALKADIELGGTDQKFNLMVARDVMREYGLEPEIAVIMPILVGTDGVQKMSKSLGNYIGISEPASEIYGKIMSVSDELMLDYYRILRIKTGQELEEIKKLMESGDVHPKDVKKDLARVLVATYYDNATAEAAEKNFEKIHRDGGVPDRMPELRPSTNPIEIIRLLRETGFAPSNSEARRLVKQGGVFLDGERVENIDAVVGVKGGEILKVGKRRFARLVID